MLEPNNFSLERLLEQVRTKATADFAYQDGGTKVQLTIGGVMQHDGQGKLSPVFVTVTYNYEDNEATVWFDSCHEAREFKNPDTSEVAKFVIEFSRIFHESQAAIDRAQDRAYKARCKALTKIGVTPDRAAVVGLATLVSGEKRRFGGF